MREHLKWQDRSFLIEIKSRSEVASVFVDCPLLSLSSNSSMEDEPSSILPMENNEPAELVKVGNQSLVIIANWRDGGDASHSDSTVIQRYIAKFSDIVLDPKSLSAMSWVDHKRLFMCKVRVDADGIPFLPKSLRHFEEEIASNISLRQYVKDIGESASFTALCRECGRNFHTHHNAKDRIEFGVLPDDDWLDTAPSMDYYCAQSCGSSHMPPSASSIGVGDRKSDSCHHNTHAGGGLLSFSNLADSASKWLPNLEKIVLTNSFLMLHENEQLKRGVILANGNILACSECSSQIGTILNRHTNIFKLHFSAIRIHGDNCEDCYIIKRFGSFERYFAWLLLYKIESQSSMKLLIRTYDRKPYLLVWILEPYIVMTNGILQEYKKSSIEPTQNENISFPALKVLYKIFDVTSATSDPRANGGDSSVGIVEVPLSCCLNLTEILLASSHTLPPPLRAVGQLYVGYLRLKDRID